MLNEREVLEGVLRAVAKASEGAKVPRSKDRLVDDLGFDSMRLTVLAIELEEQFSKPIALNDWVVGAPSYSDLTVQSLADYLHVLFAEGA